VATVSLEFGIEYGWSAEMGDLYVVPAWRGRGVSRALIGGIEDFLRRKRASGYQVTVTPIAEALHGMRQYYQALGFEDDGRVILYRKL
jgi:GNAT superfamily N-acetyltransferase